MIRFILLAALSLPALSAAQPPASETDLAALVATANWFKLRDAVQRPSSPAYYRGVAACAFHDPVSAEKYFALVFHSEPQSERAFDAHGRLAYLYMRTGQHKRAYQHLAAMQRINPGFSGLAGALDLFSALSHYPELHITRRRAARLAMTPDYFLPLSVNGQPALYGFDSGMNISMMSDAETRRLGLPVHDATTAAELKDVASGKTLPVRFVVVDRLAIGGTELRNVVFTLVPNDAMPFRELPADKQGYIGLPVLLALQTMRWTNTHAVEIGPSHARRAPSPNLSFDAATPLASAAFEGKPIAAWIDTGASKTYLTPRFAREFPAAVERNAIQATALLRGVAGTAEVPVSRLREFRFTLGGANIALKPVDLLPEQAGVDRGSYHLWLGMDVLGVARSVAFDFRAMTIAVEQ